VAVAGLVGFSNEIMSWKITRFTSSLISLFSEAAPDLGADDRIEVVREAMLHALDGVSMGAGLEEMIRRLHWAPHAQSLWYMRSDLMTILSGHYGEHEARKRLRLISAKFGDLIPKGQKARVSPLNRHH
jgi:hypothetical protein